MDFEWSFPMHAHTFPSLSLQRSLNVVCYMILRVKHEKYNKEELCQELLSKDGGTIANAIELSDYEEQNMTIS